MPTIDSLIISDEDELQSLADDWNRLAKCADPKSVYLRHEWSDASWQWLKKEGCELRVICVQRDGELIGVCPLVRHRVIRAGISLIELKGLAVPDTQEFSLIADPKNVSDVVTGLMNTLKSGRVSWDIMSLATLPVDLPATQALEEMAPRFGLGVETLKSHENPGINLEGDWEAYYARRSRRLKKGNNLVRNRLKRDNKDVEIQCFDCSSEGLELQSLLKTLTKLSASSWKADTGLTLDNAGPGAFLTRLSEHAISNSWFLVWLLTIDQEPAAMEYQLEFNGVISGLRADYDAKFEDYSPGTLLNWRIIERLFDRDACYYALGPGSNPYKLRWVEEGRKLRDIVFYGTSIRARGLRTLEMRIKPILRRLFQKKASAGSR